MRVLGCSTDVGVVSNMVQAKVSWLDIAMVMVELFAVLFMIGAEWR